MFMANGLPSFVKEEKTKLLFSGQDKEMVAYIPEKYFDRHIAEQIGEYIEIIGIFSYTVQDLKTGKNNGLKLFRFPTLFVTKPGSIEKVKGIQLSKDSEVEDYRVFRYRDGDEIASSTEVVQSIANVEKFINLWYVLGSINNVIPYDKLVDYILDNMALNGNSYGLNVQMIGFTVSELCRSVKDPKIPFRLSGSDNMHAYKSLSVKNNSKLTSPYTAIISEDFDESLIYAMMNETPKDTPLEKVLMGPE
jgi:hypothetical protein